MLVLHTAISRPKLDLKGDHSEAIGGRGSVCEMVTCEPLLEVGHFQVWDARAGV